MAEQKRLFKGDKPKDMFKADFRDNGSFRAGYVLLLEGRMIERTEAVADSQVMLDFDKDGDLIGVEILSCSFPRSS